MKIRIVSIISNTIKSSRSVLVSDPKIIKKKNEIDIVFALDYHRFYLLVTDLVHKYHENNLVMNYHLLILESLSINITNTNLRIKRNLA